MNKKIILLPLAVLALGTISGCNSNQGTKTASNSKFFYDATNQEYEKKLALSDSLKNYNLTSAIIDVENSLVRTNTANANSYERFTSSKMDESVYQVSKEQSVVSTNKTDSTTDLTKTSYKLFKDHILDYSAQNNNLSVINDTFKHEYINESISSTYLTRTDKDVNYLTSNNHATYFNKDTNYYTNEYSGGTIESYQNIIDGIYDISLGLNTALVTQQYYTLKDRIETVKTIGDIPSGKIAKYDDNHIYFYQYCSSKVTADDTTIHDVVNNTNYLLNNRLTDEQKSKINNEVNNYAIKGVSFVLNPTNTLNPDDVDTVDKIKSNCMSIFDYFIPVYNSEESLLVLTKVGENYLLTSSAFKVGSYLLKNEENKTLDNPICYSTVYTNINFEYVDELPEHQEVILSKDEVAFPYSVESASLSSYFSGKMYDTSLFEIEGTLPKNVRAYRGWFKKNTSSNLFGLNVNNTNGVINHIGYNAITDSNYEITDLRADPESAPWGIDNPRIKWPSECSEAYIVVYLNENDGTVYTDKDKNYGLSITFYKTNTEYDIL